jgi:hypothetical protein
LENGLDSLFEDFEEISKKMDELRQNCVLPGITVNKWFLDLGFLIY